MVIPTTDHEKIEPHSKACFTLTLQWLMAEFKSFDSNFSYTGNDLTRNSNDIRRWTNTNSRWIRVIYIDSVWIFSGWPFNNYLNFFMFYFQHLICFYQSLGFVTNNFLFFFFGHPLNSYFNIFLDYHKMR